MVELKNERIAIKVAPLGAELQSITDNNGREYLWQADPDFWPRHSPILFPIVCSVNNDTYTVDGKQYHLPRHGFARDTEFTLVRQSKDRVTYALHDSEETLKVYPYHFNLAISYRLDGNKVVVTWHVEKQWYGRSYPYRIVATLPDYISFCRVNGIAVYTPEELA